MDLASTSVSLVVSLWRASLTVRSRNLIRSVGGRLKPGVISRSFGGDIDGGKGFSIALTFAREKEELDCLLR